MPLPSNLTEEFHVSSQAEWKPIEKGSDTGNETNLKAFHSKIHRFTCKESSQLVPAGLLNKVKGFSQAPLIPSRLRPV